MIQRAIQLTYQHRVVFTHGAFEKSNLALCDLVADAAELGGPSKLIFFIDQGVDAANPKLREQIETYCKAHSNTLKLVSPPLVLPGGESCKNDWALVDKVWQALNFHAICRHSYVVAIGGGAFLDLAGFAAATAHRGLRLIRMPTTTLSQGDGGVGVKNGVNYFGKKNWIGTFSVPFAVVNDLNFLRTLPEGELRAGLIEAIKVSLIRDAEFFEFLKTNAERLAALETGPFETAIRRSAELHVHHIATSGDPFEYGSARPLDFGHWVAHKLEQITNFRVGHGEAVAIGMAVDLLYSVRIGLLDRATCDRVLTLISTVGFRLWQPDLDQRDAVSGKPVILQGLEEFREHLGGRLTITLVPKIGQKVEVHVMEENQILGALDDLRKRYGAASKSASAASSAASVPVAPETEG